VEERRMMLEEVAIRHEAMRDVPGAVQQLELVPFVAVAEMAREPEERERGGARRRISR